MTRDSGPLWAAKGGTSGDHIPWGANHHRVFRERFNHSLNVAVLTEDLPEEHNRITIDPVLTDSDGIPAPKATYRVGDNTNKMLDHGIARATEVLEAAGARDVITNRVPKLGGWHLMGTARTGTDPVRSVVDPWGRAHDVPNLFLVDGSVMVTSGAVNVTSTIQAIALRTADYINRNRREL